MTPESIVARERRFAVPVAVAAFASVAAFVASILVNSGIDINDSGTDAQFLASFDDNSGTLLLATVLQAAGMLLVIAPLFYLFQAASARSETMRGALVGVTVAGPLFLALGTVLQWVAFDHAASEFASAGGGARSPGGRVRRGPDPGPGHVRRRAGLHLRRHARLRGGDSCTRRCRRCAPGC